MAINLISLPCADFDPTKNALPWQIPAAPGQTGPRWPGHAHSFRTKFVKLRATAT